MNIDVKRDARVANATLGKLYVDGRYQCETLEDVVRPPGVKIYGQTAIPAGEYRVLVTISSRFKRPLPLLVDVPGFEGVRIHPGNTDADTEGCILVGRGRERNIVTDSRAAFGPLFELIQAAVQRLEPVTIRITNGEGIEA